MKRKIAGFLLSFLCALTACAQDCGEYRWKIKTLSDADTVHIRFNQVIQSSVHEQANLNRPKAKFARRLKSEITVYSINCYLIGYKNEKDKDIHLILQDPVTYETMVAEILSPLCLDVKRTGRYRQVLNLYKWFKENVGIPRSSFTYLREKKAITLTGVGFWDSLHKSKSRAPNGREIHPVLSMRHARVN